MKTTLAVAVFTCLILSAGAQTFQPPDYSRIETETKDPNSQYYYPTLRERYDRYDTTLTLKDFRHLYYGFFFQPDYQLRAPDNEKLNGYYRKNSLSEADCEKVIELATEALRLYPFDLRLINLLSYVFNLQKNDRMEKLSNFRYRFIIETIMSTGDGNSCATGYHVTSISDEYTLMRIFKLNSVSQSLEDHCDYLKAEENDQKVEGLYFDITEILEKESAAFGFDPVKPKKNKEKKKKKE